MRSTHTNPAAIPVQCFAPAAVSVLLTTFLGALFLLKHDPAVSKERIWKEPPAVATPVGQEAAMPMVASQGPQCLDSSPLTGTSILCAE